MPFIPSITVYLAYADVKPGAAIIFLNDAGIDYRFIVADELRVNYVDQDGMIHSWTGFRPDHLTEAA